MPDLSFIAMMAVLFWIAITVVKAVPARPPINWLAIVIVGVVFFSIIVKQAVGGS
jgi:hypothetical protein